MVRLRDYRKSIEKYKHRDAISAVPFRPARTGAVDTELLSSSFDRAIKLWNAHKALLSILCLDTKIECVGSTLSMGALRRSLVYRICLCVCGRLPKSLSWCICHFS